MIHENVPTHTFWVSYYAMSFQMQHGWCHSVMNKIMMYSLVHDITESVTGDVVRTFKHSNKKLNRVISKNESKHFKSSVSDLSNAVVEEVMSRVDKYTKAVVKLADFMSIYKYLSTEYEMGNRVVVPFIKKAIEDLDKMSKGDTSYIFKCGDKPVVVNLKPEYEEMRDMLKELIQ